jgi:hypothetical protein
MLTITDTAGTLVTEIVNRAVSTDTGGLRIAETTGDRFSVSVAEAPGVDEVVAAQGDARVFMDEPVAEALDDKVLDARRGEDGAVEFLISTRKD